MIAVQRLRPLFVLTFLNSVVVCIAASAGIRNVQIYAPFTPVELLPGAVSQDIVSLVAVAGLWICALFIRKGSRHAWLVWVGLNGYLFYAYALYSFEQIYNPFILLYIVATGLSFYSIVAFITWLEPETYRHIDLSRLPQRVIAVYLLALVLMFTAIWMSLIIPGIQSSTPPNGASIFVIDLAFILPMLAIVAVALWRRQSCWCLQPARGLPSCLVR